MVNDECTYFLRESITTDFEGMRIVNVFPDKVTSLNGSGFTISGFSKLL